jgi:hypothetical protein
LNLGFTTKGRLADVLIIPSSWGSQRAVLTSHQRASSQLADALVIAEEKRQLLHRVELTQQDMSVHQSSVQQF